VTPPLTEYLWRFAEPIPEGTALELQGWPQPLRQLLYNRGLRTALDVEEFLHPERVGLHDPFLLKDMEVAVDRVLRALRHEEHIAVYGDFDVDGLTAVALLLEVLESPSLQGRVMSYLPHRNREGYGLNPNAIKGLAEKGVGLLITVDCGIGADDEIRLASSLGMDVIVTDHHSVSKGLPPALAVVNPRQDGCRYPFGELAGVGVAYKLAEALFSRMWDLPEARRRLEPVLDLVALGTVADLAPLVGENRLMVKAGLAEMRRGNRLGLRALVSQAGWAGRTVDTDAISYGLAPRLNAAGRMGDSRLSLEVLTCRDVEEAERLAADLEVTNRERQTATVSALNAAREELSQSFELPPAIVLVGDYPSGIVGLVANRLAEEYHRPAFVIEGGPGECRGSGRGVLGFDVVQTLAGASELLVRFGGHAQAAGFTVDRALIGDLKAYIQERAEGAGVEVRRELELEGALRAQDLGPSLFEMLTLLEPFGVGNRRPLFCSRGLQVRDARVVGSGHLKLRLMDETGLTAAIGFGMGTEEYAFVRQGALVDCAYVVGRNERGGMVSYEMVLKDLMRLEENVDARPSGAEATTLKGRSPSS